MAPPVDGSLDMYAVSKVVNNVMNNGPELLDPVARPAAEAPRGQAFPRCPVRSHRPPPAVDAAAARGAGWQQTQPLA
ncbi:hypothetical protein GCM10010530_44690 [Kribbella aluminosa]